MAATIYRSWDEVPLLMDSVMVARLFGCDESKVRKMANAGELPSYRIGKELRYSKDDIRAFLNARKVPCA